MNGDLSNQKVEVPMVHGWSRLYGKTRTFSTTLPPDLERTGLITNREYERLIAEANSIWSPLREGVENWVFPQEYDTRFWYIFGSFFLYAIVFAIEESCIGTSRQKRDRKLEETVRYFEQVNADWKQKHEERAMISGLNHEGEKEAHIGPRGEGRYLRFEMVWTERTCSCGTCQTTKRGRKIVISFVLAKTVKILTNK